MRRPATKLPPMTAAERDLALLVELTDLTAAAAGHVLADGTVVCPDAEFLVADVTAVERFNDLMHNSLGAVTRRAGIGVTDDITDRLRKLARYAAATDEMRAAPAPTSVPVDSPAPVEPEPEPAGGAA